VENDAPGCSHAFWAKGSNATDATEAIELSNSVRKFSLSLGGEGRGAPKAFGAPIGWERGGHYCGGVTQGGARSSLALGPPSLGYGGQAGMCHPFRVFGKGRVAAVWGKRAGVTR